MLVDLFGGGIGFDNCYMFDMMCVLVDDVVLFDELLIVCGIVYVYWEEWFVVEGVGVVGFVVLLDEWIVCCDCGGLIVVVVSGVNIDMVVYCWFVLEY